MEFRGRRSGFAKKDPVCRQFTAFHSMNTYGIVISTYFFYGFIWIRWRGHFFLGGLEGFFHGF